MKALLFITGAIAGGTLSALFMAAFYIARDGE